MNQADYNFLLQLHSLYQAFSATIADPVAIPSDVPIGDVHSTFGIQYLDTLEDLEEAKTIARHRAIHTYGDMRMHHRAHTLAYKYFRKIEERINVGDRKGVLDTLSSLETLTEDYTTHVERHKSAHHDHAFLRYPVYRGDHIFFISQAGLSMGAGSWNAQSTKEGMLEELENLREEKTDFLIREEPLKPSEGVIEFGRGEVNAPFIGRNRDYDRLLNEKATILRKFDVHVE